jgi:hypothetical protein
MGILVLFALPFLLIGGLINLIWMGGVWVVNWLMSHRERKRAAIERELNRTQLELRATILRLASELGADAHEARKALIRESYLASGRTPTDRE